LASTGIDYTLQSDKKNFSSIRDRLTDSDIIKLVGALWDGDGCICVSRNTIHISYHSLSIALVEDTQYVLAKLGINSSINKCHANLYGLRIAGRRSKDLFLSTIDTVKVKKAELYASKLGARKTVQTVEKIVSIEAIDVVDYPMYDITVDNTHTFISNGVVSHNCMGAAKFQIYARQTYGVTMTLEEAIASRAVYFNAYPGLTSYHARFKNNSLREARTLDKYKRRRLWENYPGPPGLSNVAIQGGAANIQKLAIACIYEELHEKGYSPTQSHDIKQVLTVHDELELEAKLELAEYAREMLSRHMVEAGESIVSTCPIKADASIVMNLAEKD
jgi:DNA polymerase family A/LAGLIDADG-like domain